MPTTARLPAAALLSLTLVLTACGGAGSDPGTGTGGGGGGTVPTPPANGCAAAKGSAGGLSVAALPAPLATQTPAPDWSAPHVPGEVLLNLTTTQGGVSVQSLSTLSGVAALSGVRVQQVAPDLAVAYTPQGSSDQAFAGQLSAQGLSAQPNFVYAALSTPNDPGYPGNAGVPVGDGLYDQDYLTRIRADDAWAAAQACGKTTSGVLTAVLDTGVDSSHPDLAGRLLPGRSYNNQGQSSKGAPEIGTSEGDRGHGTGVAGLIGAATDNGAGLSGVTWATGGQRTLLPIKVLGNQGGSTTAIRAGLNYAVSQGAKVINMSLGIKGNPGDKALDSALNSAAQSAVLVAAAGNTSGDGIYYPASHPAVLAVGAVGRADSLACYSARPGSPSGSRQLDLVAPGGNAGTSATVTTGTAECYQGNPYDQLTLTATDQGSYALRAGTSEAAPLVSGAASLVWGVNPGLSAGQVRQILLSTTTSVNGLKLLNVGAAVRAALN